MTTVANNNIANAPIAQTPLPVVAEQPIAQPAYTTTPMPAAPVSYGYVPSLQSYPQMVQGQPGAPASAVNIIINSPTVNPAAANVANSNNSYCYGNPNNPCGAIASYPAGYYTAQPQKASSDEVARAYVANSAIKEETKADEKKEKKEVETEKKEIVQLTDDYIKTLENYLNSQNKEIRKMGVKELAERFKEHESRKNDIALTNLLNKALQDPVAAIRFIAMGILASGYAVGDSKSIALLKQMQKSDSVYGDDAHLASEILLKMSSSPVSIDVPVKKSESKKEAK